MLSFLVAFSCFYMLSSLKKKKRKKDLKYPCWYRIGNGSQMRCSNRISSASAHRQTQRLPTFIYEWGGITTCFNTQHLCHQSLDWHTHTLTQIRDVYIYKKKKKKRNGKPLLAQLLQENQQFLLANNILYTMHLNRFFFPDGLTYSVYGISFQASITSMTFTAITNTELVYKFQNGFENLPFVRWLLKKCIKIGRRLRSIVLNWPKKK